jgi:uroporphyrinogen-III decarboxylase
MSKAKETVGKVSCIAGNVPLDLLCTGSPDEMRTYCKNLIDVAGKGGGFILSTGAGIQGSKAPNVMAMIESSIEYGVYK